MPELPEVHTIVSDLNSNISGYKISGVRIEKNYKTIPDNDTFKKSVLGQSITQVERIAKNIIIHLSSDNYILIHLAMTGRVLLRNKQDKSDGWTKVILDLEKNGEQKQLRFTDTRMFGKIGVVGGKAIQGLVDKYGPEPISQNLADEQFLGILRSKKTNIKNALLDQSLVSGLGNIYATEALFLAGIDPHTNTAKITPENAKKLLEASKKILLEGISNRGSTLPDKAYVDIFGKEGSQQNFFRIYMKEKCPTCGTRVTFTKLNGRGTYFCPNCQPPDGQGPLFK
jgi:formamidopyrimidine-DNA glycosylase